MNLWQPWIIVGKKGSLRCLLGHFVLHFFQFILSIILTWWLLWIQRSHCKMSPLTQPKVSSRYKVCSLLPDCLKGEVLVIETKEGGIGYLLHILKVRRTYRRTYLLDIGSGSLPIHECSVTVLYKRSVVLRKSKGIKDVIQ